MQLVVLRLEQGPDFYMQVFGAYAQSAFGTPLSVLISRQARAAGASAIGVPQEVWRLVDGILQRGGLANAQVCIIWSLV
jgi:hypothetical protein